jgi:hypothetical protein
MYNLLLSFTDNWPFRDVTIAASRIYQKNLAESTLKKEQLQSLNVFRISCTDAIRFCVRIWSFNHIKYKYITQSDVFSLISDGIMFHTDALEATSVDEESCGGSIPCMLRPLNYEHKKTLSLYLSLSHTGWGNEWRKWETYLLHSNPSGQGKIDFSPSKPFQSGKNQLPHFKPF